MLKKIPLITLALLLNACSTSQIHIDSKDESKIGVESIGRVGIKALADKTLHSHSAMQCLMLQSKGFNTAFSPDSDDAFVENDYAASWFETLLKTQNKEGILVSGDFASEEKVRVLKIKNFHVSDYTSLANTLISDEALKGESFSQKYLYSLNDEAKELLAMLSLGKHSKVPTSEILDKLFGVANTKGVSLYFGLDKNSKVLRVSTTPVYSKELTPYKRQFFINFLNARGIKYRTNGNSVAIEANFSSWVVAMNKLQKLNKYHNAIYGIYDGQNFFEVADGTFQKTPINVELIDWVPGGKREYNVYAGGYNRKITTNEQFYDFYLPDGSKKYIIRFY